MLDRIWKKITEIIDWTGRWEIVLRACSLLAFVAPVIGTLIHSSEQITLILSILASITGSILVFLWKPQVRTVYDSRKSYDLGFDFRGIESYVYDDKGNPISPQGRGQLECKERVLNINRQNTDGRYSVWLDSYVFNGTKRNEIPKDELIVGQRKMRVSFEAKNNGIDHTLVFLLKNEKTGKWLDSQKIRVTADVWTPFKVYLRIPNPLECKLRIDDEEISDAPSSVQIRNLILDERV